jgi:dolichol-phosphate mannosyltransferase
MITVIIPTYNEKKNIGRVIKKVLDLKVNNLQILVVDDSSPDGTSTVVEKLMKKYTKLHIIINKEKKGLGKAYLVGMDYAVKKLNSDILVEMDADLSHNPNILPKMLSFIPKYDMVLGSRYIKGGSIPKDWAIYRKFISYFGNFIFRLCLSMKIKDWTTGYRVIKSEVYKKIKPEIDKEIFYGYTFQAGFLYKSLEHGFKIREYPLNFKDRVKGKSKIQSLKYIVKNIQFIIKTKLNI